MCPEQHEPTDRIPASAMYVLLERIAGGDRNEGSVSVLEEELM